METETVSARNVVDLLLHDEFGKGICPPSHADEVEDGGVTGGETVTREENDDFVYGFDC